MNYYGMAEDNEQEQGPKRTRKEPRVNPHFTAQGERIPPVAKPFNRRGCQWINGIGWVWNPTHRYMSLGDR